MNKIKILFLTFCLIILTVISEAGNVVFASQPTLSNDGAYVVFVRRGDLWKVSSQGGEATRLTAMVGSEIKPRVSPDGKWIAFSSNQKGNNDVYLYSTSGGEIKQLTVNSQNDVVSSWSWDSKHIYFTSNRYNSISSYRVSINGGTPERLIGNHYHSSIHDIVENPLTEELYFTDSGESSSSAHRKRYKGANNPDIKSFNKKSLKFQVHTTYNGKDLWPVFDKHGKFYFVSDEKNGEYNLCSLKDGKKIFLTKFNTSIKQPQVSADGETIVFEKDYRVYIYNTSTKKSKVLPIYLSEVNSIKNNQKFKVAGNISNFDVSLDNKKIVFVSRGELFVSDIKGKFVKQINVSGDERVVEAVWSSDNNTILFTQTDDGWSNLFKISADGRVKSKQLTFDKQNCRALSTNDKKSKLVYTSGRNELRVLNLKTFKQEVQLTDEIWGLKSNRSMFSPCGNYILYTAVRDFETEVMVYDIKRKQKINITNSGVSENSPYWSPCGKHIYISVDRYKASFPRMNVDPVLYRIALDRFDKEFRSDRYNKLFADETKSEKSKKDESKQKQNIEETTINLEGIANRWENIYVRGGKQYSPFVVQKKETTTILFTSNHDGAYALWKIERKPFEKESLKKIQGVKWINGIVQSSDKIFTLSKGNIFEINLNINKATKINISYSFQRNLDNEFKQIFYETWATLQENFYDENFHNVNWDKVKKEYEEFLPRVGSRADLRILLNDMLGELNASHLGFSSRGDEEKTYYKSQTLFTGIMFSNEKPYVVDRVLKKSSADRVGIDLRAGDVLKMVNGVNVDDSENRNKYFTNASQSDEIDMLFKRGDIDVNVKVHATDWGVVSHLLYDEWIESNQKIVDEKSSDRIAYAFMKDMGSGSLKRFLLDMTTELYRKDALILDIRYNRGGNIHDDVLQFLSQKPYLKWKYRGTKMSPQPNFAPSGKPIVLLINEQSLSDAEVTTTGFKELGLGTVIGEETYRWIIFTSGKRLVDGSYCRLPAWGCYSLDGRNLELTGETPDIRVKNKTEDKFKGDDPQLNRAIKEILKQLKK